MSPLLAATRAELTKMLTSRTVRLFVGVVIGLHLLISWVNLRQNIAAVDAITPQGVIELFPGEPRPAERAIVELLAASTLQIVAIFLPVVAAVIAGQEFRAGQLSLSMLAVPRRGRLLASKSIAIALFLSAVTVVVEAISTLFVWLAVKDWNPGLLTTGPALGEQGRLLLFAVTTGLVSFALTTIVRGTLGGVVVTVALLFLAMGQVLAPVLDALLPISAGRNLILDPVGNNLTAGPAYAVVVLIGWSLMTVAAAGWVLHRRDAR